MIAEPDELGDALGWMLETAQGAAPSTVAELAERLGISQAQTYKYLNGETVPPEKKWDAILDAYGFTGPARGTWATAGQRVRDRMQIRRARERQNQNQRVDPVPAPTASDRESSSTRPHRDHRRRVKRIAMLVAALILVATAVLIVLRNTSGASGSGAAPVTLDVQCLGLGSTTTWQNHHSRRYLSITSDPRGPDVVDPAKAAATPPIVLTGRGEETADGNCANSFSNLSTPGSPLQCLTAVPEPSAALPIHLAECDNSPEQRWVLENHWPFENVMWQRVMPAGNINSCLQEMPRGNGAVSVILQPCGSDWRQQWKISPRAIG